jgi:hypothetical protein
MPPRPSPTSPACPDHSQSKVVSVGSRSTRTGATRRYRCTPEDGDSEHTFSVREKAPAHVLRAAGVAPAPVCPHHPEAKVVRNGTYGTRTSKPRQRYRCTPSDGTKPHSFTPPLPRDHVHVGAEQCDHCDELRGVHHGETAVARRHSWSTRVVARGLDQLSTGETYAEVSRWAVRATGKRRSRVSQAENGPAESSRASRESRNTWHIAADWVEAFSPVVYAPIDARLRRRALEERERLDALVSAGAPQVRPQVVLVDDIPVYGRDLERRTSRRDTGYYILVVAELHWADEHPADDPFTPDGDPQLRLRLVRAMPKSNAQAWRLVFDELGYSPDYLVADAGTGIGAAYRAHLQPSGTKFIPSLWHLAGQVKSALAAAPAASVVTPAGKELVKPLRDHMSKLGRQSDVLSSSATWSGWWDELEALLTSLRLPVEKVRTRRKNYEPAMAAVLPELAVQPRIPVSTGGLETLIAKRVMPMLALRRTAFANIERTNLLLDLVVARQHGAFDNLGDVANLLRQDAAAHGGWTVALRTIADPRPRGGSYSSLRDATLINTLASERGLT